MSRFGGGGSGLIGTIGFGGGGTGGFFVDIAVIYRMVDATKPPVRARLTKVPSSGRYRFRARVAAACQIGASGA